MVYASKTKRRKKGHIRSMPKSKYQQIHWSSWARPRGKHEDTYKLNRKDFVEVSMISAQLKGMPKYKQSAQGSGRREQDQGGNNRIHTSWRDDMLARWRRFDSKYMQKSSIQMHWSQWARPRGEKRDTYGLIGCAKMQVSAKTLVVMRKTKRKTG